MHDDFNLLRGCLFMAVIAGLVVFVVIMQEIAHWRSRRGRAENPGALRITVEPPLADRAPAPDPPRTTIPVGIQWKDAQRN